MTDPQDPSPLDWHYFDGIAGELVVTEYPYGANRLGIGIQFTIKAHDGTVTAVRVPGGIARHLTNEIVAALDEREAPIGSGLVATRSTSAQLRETQAALAASQADLTAMEKQRGTEAELALRIAQLYDAACAERDELRAQLAAVDAAAGRDIAKPDERLVDRVADLLRGRTEATERALELAAELASARTELEQLRSRNAELERLRGES